jgi:hypothetical protein
MPLRPSPITAGLLLAAATSCGTKTDSGATCGPTGMASERCPADPCARECPSVEAATGCCLARDDARGLDAESAAELAAICPPETCDPDTAISATAALCLAQVQGAELGREGWCGASRIIPVDGAPQWEVATPYSGGGYTLYYVNVETGELSGGTTWVSQ